jgi:hypothetical protein
VNNASVIKINEKLENYYFAMAYDISYFLGQDIESISFIDNHFYYVSYNPKYEVLENAESCSKEVKSLVDDWKASDYYYKYGRINFLEEYYQKLSSKTYKVEDRCNELANKGNDE